MTEKLSVLIVDDNRTNLALMDMLVRKLPNCSTLLQTDPSALLAGLEGLEFDIAVFACHPPQLDGIGLARRVKALPHLRDRPVLLAADEPDPALVALAHEAGIAAVLNKPIDPVEFRQRIMSLARGGDGSAAHPRADGAAWEAPARAPADISPHEEELLTMMVRVAGYKDRETPLHSQRVARYCAILAHHLGLPEEYCRTIRRAAPLHDVGKAGLSDAVLRRNGFLSPEEKREMEEHTRIGHAILSGAHAPVFRMAAEIALTHHERWDGSGYPQRLKGEQIPLAGRIAAIADVFDALTSVRSYKSAWTIGNAFNYLHENAGEQFDPACVAAFESGREDVSAVMLSMPDEQESAADAA